MEAASYWAVVQTKPSMEETAATGLRRQLGADTCLPMIRPRPKVKGRPVRMRALFPGYVFAKANAWYGYRDVPGVVKLVMDGTEPARLPDDVLAEIRSRMGKDGVVAVPKFGAGQKVKMERGPFWYMVGIFDATTREGRARVLYQLLGVETPVEVNERDLVAA